MAPSLLLFILLMVMPALLHRLALSGERRVKARRWESLAEVPEEEPRGGWKTAQVLLAADGSRATLWGVTVGGAYEVDDVAVCRSRGCAPPGLDCDCGFYAFRSRAEALDLLRQTLACNGLRDKALLSVEVEGSVLQYERGYRAERQRVLGVQLERLCGTCREHGIGRVATRLAASWSYRLPTFARFTGAGSSVASGLLPVRPVCDDHVPAHGRVLGLGDLAGLLGTEVSWLP
jgi:hypothetical protein